MSPRLRPRLVPLLLAAVAAAVTGAAHAQDSFAPVRERMVDQVRERGVRQQTLLRAMETVPRHLFVPEDQRAIAYEDRPLSIGWNEYISTPYLSAKMIELLELDGSEKVLEIGTGSGYDAALLSRIAREVYTIELNEELGRRAQENLAALGYKNVHVRIGNGYDGWAEAAPFDAIILTAAPERMPEQLLDQLEMSGRMVVPVGSFVQELRVITKTKDGKETETVTPVHLSPMRKAGPAPPRKR